MKKEWLNKKGNTDLILFFAGWGMDPNPFRQIPARDSDVLMFFDYRPDSAPLAIKDITQIYDSLNVIAWSLGVSVASNYCRDNNLTPDVAIAVNGTPYPAHDKYGIPESIFDGTLESLSEENLLKFYRRMCGSKDLLNSYTETLPARPFDDIKEELMLLKSISPCIPSIFQKAIIYTDDRIVPPENQQNCWEEHGVEVKTIPGPHFPFNSYSCWEEIIDN